MKIEISNSDDTYRLTDGEEDGITGQIVPYGERSILDETVPESEQWWCEIDDNGECDGLAHKGDFPDGPSEPVSFELDCEFDDDEDGEPEDAEPV